jgi:plastocyanin
LQRTRIALALLALAAAGVAAAYAVPALGSASSPARAGAVTIAVTGSDTGVRLSRASAPRGTVVFRISNKGRRTHVFVVAGKRTTVRAHRSASSTIVFRAAGSYKWTWTGGKSITGKIRITAPAGGGGGTTTVTTTTTTTVPGPATTVTVDMFEYRFALSQTSVPSGQVTFVITNRGSETHNFDIAGVKAGTILAPGTSETWTVGLLPKSYQYVCDVPFHIDRGMVGTLTVTSS